ncbi:MAG: TIM-barrel domain-containing protein [Sphingobacteriales bacterium]
MIAARLFIKTIGIRALVLLALSVLIPAFSFAQTGNDFGKSICNGKNLIISTNKGYIEITPYTSDVINVTYKSSLRDIVKSYSTIGQPTSIKAVYVNNKNFAGIKTSALKVLVDKRDLSVSFIDNKNHLLSKSFNYVKMGDSSTVSFKSDGKEAFYGGGSKAIYLNRRGTVLQNNNQAHYDYHFGQTDINISIPFMVSSRGYGLYLDNAAESSFNVCKTDAKVLGYKTTSGLVSFYFVGGGSMDGVLKNYTFLTGRQPLPPRWSMGYISSRYGYKSEREITDVVNKTRAAGIPIDAVVFDLYWYKASKFMGNYNWAPDSFPNPKRMLANLLNNHIRVVTISETYITKKSENFKAAVDQHLFASDITKKGSPYIFDKFWAGPSGLLDVFKPSAQQFYWNFYKARIKDGTAGWWFDLGEPESNNDSLQYIPGTNKQVHNVYALVWAKFAFDGYRKDFPNSRILLLPRSGFAGMQRYSTFPWSGDIDRSFAGLKAQIPIIISMGLDGVGYMHSDAGGFTGGGDKANKDPELYSRWLEFAAFTPVMRTHAGAVHYSPEPIYWDDTTRLRVTIYIKLRYAMLPYNYTMAYKNTTTGRPLVLGVNYFEPENKRLENVNDEYLWGDEILVAPVIVKGQTTKKVLFPKGEWIGFNDHKSYKDSASVYAPIDSLPLFVKAGIIIPMARPYTYTEQYDGKSLILKYYVGKSSATTTSQWFYDDGKDPNSLKNGKYDLVNFTTSGKGKTHTISITPKHLLSKIKNFKLIIADKQLETVSFSNKTAYIIAVSADGNKEIDFKWNGRPLILSVKTM